MLVRLASYDRRHTREPRWRSTLALLVEADAR
jgi:hypothetical protein